METLRILAVHIMLVLLLPRKYNFEGCFGSKPDILFFMDREMTCWVMQ
jgi:hypothetical protein